MLHTYRLVYLATPYSKYPSGIMQAHRDACKLAGRLLKRGVRVYSPIAHTHSIAMNAMIDPYQHDIWLPFDEAMMAVSEVLVVAQMPSWEISKGIKFEVDYFELEKKPIYDLNPATLEATRRGV